MTLSENAKTMAFEAAMGSMTREEYFEIATEIQQLAEAANITDVKEGHDLCDYAFAGLLWSKGLLDGTVMKPVEVPDDDLVRDPETGETFSG